jgi:tetratricopeptide (TPR) repeat protein
MQIDLAPSAIKNRMLGELYYKGLGTESDMEKAKHHFEVGMKGSGDNECSAYSAFQLGGIYLSESRFEEALEAFKVAEQLEHDEAPERVSYLKQVIDCFEVSKTDRKALRKFDIRLRSDRCFVRWVLEVQGFNLDFVCDEFKNDEGLVFLAAWQTPLAFQFASSRLQGDRAFVRRLLTAPYEEGIPRKLQNLRGDNGVSLPSGWVLEFASAELQDDYEMVSLAVSQCGGALKFASTRLRGQKNVVITAVKQDGLALEFALDDLCSNAEVVSAAVAQNASAMRFAADALRGDAEFVLLQMQRSSFALRYASRELREDPEFVMKAIKKDGLSLRWASEKLCIDPDLLVEAEQRCGWAVSQAPKELLDDSEFMLKATQRSNQAFKFASDRIRGDPSLVSEALQTKGGALQFAPSICHGTLKMAREMVEVAVRQNSSSLYYADNDLREDPKFLNECFASQIKCTKSQSRKLGQE